MSIEKYYISCTRKRKTEDTNDRGRNITSYVETPILGYKSLSNQKIMTIAGKDTIVNQYKFYTNDLDLQALDIIVYDGFNYEVVSDPKNTANKNHHIKAIIRKVDNVS